MDKKIDLEEILGDNCVNIGFLKTAICPDGIKGSQGQRILNAMRDLAEQILELAAENAEIDSIATSDDSSGFIHEINKQSILDTIKQIV